MKAHQYYKDIKSRQKERIVISYHYQHASIKECNGFGHLEIFSSKSMNLTAAKIQEHVQKTLEQDIGWIKPSVVILGVTKL